MWLIQLIYFIISFFNLCVSEEHLPFQNEELMLTELFFENLKKDPVFSVNDTIERKLSEISKNVIEKRVDNFVELLTQSQRSLLPREKRSLKDGSNQNNTSYVRFSNFTELPLHSLDAVQIFSRSTKLWYASLLENRDNFSIFQYADEKFSLVCSRKNEYTTNLALVLSEESTIFVIGTNEKIKIYEFFTKSMKKIQELAVTNATLVQIWHSINTKFLVVTSDIEKISKVWIYKWKGKHFDLIQIIESFNVKKAFGFEINNVPFLVLAKNEQKIGNEKQYSEIYKYDFDTYEFTLHQKIYTPDCQIFKYFKSVLNGERQHFLIVSINILKDSRKTQLTVLYKFIENYFVPFQSLDVKVLDWQPIQDKFQNAALIALTKSGFKSFLYDDWHFYETKIFYEISKNSLEKFDWNLIRTFEFEEDNFLVISCRACPESSKILKINFTRNSELNKLRANLLSWCETNLRQLEDRRENDILVSESLRGDIDEEIDHEEQEVHKVSAALSRFDTTLFQLEEKINEHQNFNAQDYFQNPIFAKNIIFNEEINVNDLKTNTFNDVNIQNLLNNTVDISNGFEILDNSVEFEILTIENSVIPTTINDKISSEYLSVFDDVNLQHLDVTGSATFKSNLILEIALNNITISQNNLIMNNLDQEFKFLEIDDITVYNLNTKYLNNLDLRSPDELLIQNTTKLSKVNELVAKNIEICGLLNRVSVPVLNDKGLKKFGNQTLNNTYHFNTLEAHYLSIKKGLSGKQIPEDFVSIIGGEMTVNQDVKFLKGVNTNKLEVLTSLNNIPVNDDGDLDVVLKNSSKVQFIPAEKCFENMVLNNPIKLRNKIKNKQMEERNLIKLIDKNLRIENDVTIEGNMDVKRTLKSFDIVESSQKMSFSQVLNNCIKLTKKNVPVHLNFSKTLVVDEIFAEKISNILPGNWLLKNSENVQYIKGTKRFTTDDLRLLGSTTVENLNEIETELFEKSVFKVTGDQEVLGNFEVQFLAAENGTDAKRISFGTNSWKNVLTTDINSNFSTTIYGNVEANSIVVKNSTEVKGLFNNRKITEILKNIATKDTRFKIFGHKHFKELRIDDLSYLQNSCVKQMLNAVSKNSFKIDSNMSLKSIRVNNLVFEKRFNNITKKEFINIMELKNNKTLTVDLEILLNSLMVDGKVFINNNQINGENLSRIENDTVKIDEDHIFKDVTVESNIIVNNNLEIEGNIEHLDLDNIFDPNQENIVQNKVFLKDVIIVENLNIDGLVQNATNLTDFCRMAFPKKGEIRVLEINGDVILAKGQGISKLNGVNISKLARNIWISDRETILNGNLTLESGGEFKDKLTVNGFINAENITDLSKNYFSKTKDQKIQANIVFDTAIFEKNVSSPKLKIDGTLNDINLDEFIRTVLLDGVDQVFEDVVYFEGVEIDDLNQENDFLVNNFNLATDIMRYDQENIVTGHKKFSNLNVKSFINKGRKSIKVQNVDLRSFVENVVLKNGTFRIEGKTVLDTAVFENGLSVKGNVNSQKFRKDTVFLTNLPQTITGKKIFDIQNGFIKFKSLKVKGGLVNNVDIQNLVKNQAKNSEDVIIESEIKFEKNVFAKNVIFEDLYNDVNISELLTNITQLKLLESYIENYQNLLDISEEIEKSLKDQAQVFKHYKELQRFVGCYEYFGLKNQEGYFVIITFSNTNVTNLYRSFEWVPFIHNFVYRGEFIESHRQPYFMEQLKIHGQDFLYVEHDSEPIHHGHTPFTGHLVQLTNASNMAEAAIFPTNGTMCLSSLSLAGINQECLVFVESDMRNINILCDETGYQEYYLFDRIELKGVFKVSAVTTLHTTHLFAIVKATSTYPESHIVVLEKTWESHRFEIVQAIFEAGEPTALAPHLLKDDILLAVTYGVGEMGAVDLGRVSIRRWHLESRQYHPWQYLPLTSPLDVQFINVEKEGPILLVSTHDVNTPLFGARYDGMAGFKPDFQGRGLPTGLKLRVLNEQFILVHQPITREAILLKAEFRNKYYN